MKYQISKAFVIVSESADKVEFVRFRNILMERRAKNKQSNHGQRFVKVSTRQCRSV
jgi:hypothetical protein